MPAEAAKEDNRRETRSYSANNTMDVLKDLLSPSEISALSNDSKLLFKAIDKSISIHFKNIADQYDEQLLLKDNQIQESTTRVANLEANNQDLTSKISSLQYDIDAIDQYERRDSLILSGNILPPEIELEDSVQVIVNTVGSHLNVSFNNTQSADL